MDFGRPGGDNGIVTRRQTGLLVVLLLAYAGAIWGGSAYFTKRAAKGDRELPAGPLAHVLAHVKDWGGPNF